MRTDTGPGGAIARPWLLAPYASVWRRIARCRGALVEAIALGIVQQLVRFAPAVGLALIVDKAATSHAGATLATILAGLAILAVVEAAIGAGRDAAAAALVAHATRARDDTPARRDTSSELARDAVDALLAVATGPPLLLALVLALAFASPALGVAVAASLLTQVIVARLGAAARRAAIADRRAVERAAARRQRDDEACTDQDDIWRRAGRADRARLDAQRGDATDRITALRARAKRRATAVGRLGHVAALGVGAHAIAAGTMTTGGLIATLLVLRQMQAPLDALLAVLARAEALPTPDTPAPARVAANPDTPGQATPDHRSAIALDDVLVRVPDATAPALRVSLDIAAGTFVVVHGDSGAGKSLLLRLIAGAVAPSAGRVRRHAAATIALVPEDPRLPDASIAEVVLPGATRAQDPRRLAALELAGARAPLRKLPRGLDHPVGPGGRAIAGDLRRRLALARALAQAPDVLLVDGLPDRLDDGAASALLAHLSGARGTTTIVVATARPDWHACADRVLTLRAGRMIGDQARDAHEPAHVRSA